MNKLNFNQSVGFPIETEILDEMQNAWSLLNCLGALAGNFTIISGIDINNGNATDGFVYINGEVLKFAGGAVSTDVIINEAITSLEFEDGNENPVIYTRYATFGIGVTSFPWINFKRPKTTIQLTEEKAEQTLIETLITRITALEARPMSNVPVGMIAIWDRPANEIPVGWAEYQALRGRMPIGLDPAYDNNTNGDRTNYNLQTLNYNGGKREHQLTVPEMPSHNHNVPNTDSSLIGHQANGIATGGGGLGFVGIASAGGDLKHTIMSPYRVVQFIKYVG